MIKYLLISLLLISCNKELIIKDKRINKENYKVVQQHSNLESIIHILGPWDYKTLSTYLGTDLKEKSSETYLWYDFDYQKHPSKYEDLKTISITVREGKFTYCWMICD